MSTKNKSSLSDFILITGLLLPKFRFGWKLAIHAIPHKQSGKTGLQTLMVVAEKENPTLLHQITLSFTQSSFGYSDMQVKYFILLCFYICLTLNGMSH